MKVGVVSLQGGYGAHLTALARIGHQPVEVRLPRDLATLDALVLPGGESTTQRKLIDRAELCAPLDTFVKSGRPVLATCAGLILAATYEWLDVDVERNAYGRQLDSFTARDDANERDLVFIRAPRITRIGTNVEVISSLKGEPIIVRSGNLTAAASHPELTETGDYGALLLPASGTHH